MHRGPVARAFFLMTSLSRTGIPVVPGHLSGRGPIVMIHIIIDIARGLERTLKGDRLGHHRHWTRRDRGHGEN